MTKKKQQHLLRPVDPRRRSSPLVVQLATAVAYLYSIAPTVVVSGQYAGCDTEHQYKVAEQLLDAMDVCDNVVSPQCYCGNSTDSDSYYAFCYDSNEQCSSVNPSVCGRQKTRRRTRTADTGDYTNEYVWQYARTRGRNETLTWKYFSRSNTCSFTIKPLSSFTTTCRCEATDCNRGGPSTFLRIDCTNYQWGAYADECIDGLGISTGSVLEGLAVTFGGRCVGGSPVSAPTPTPHTPTRSPTRLTRSPTRSPTKPSQSSGVITFAVTAGTIGGLIVVFLAVAFLVARHLQRHRLQLAFGKPPDGVPSQGGIPQEGGQQSQLPPTSAWIHEQVQQGDASASRNGSSTSTYQPTSAGLEGGGFEKLEGHESFVDPWSSLGLESSAMGIDPIAVLAASEYVKQQQQQLLDAAARSRPSPDDKAVVTEPDADPTASSSDEEEEEEISV